MSNEIINTTTDDFCSKEVIFLLKEKGFDAPVMARWNIKMRKGEEFQFNTLGDPKSHNKGQYSKNYTSNPTHTQAWNWIRANFGIHISVSPVFQFNEGREDYLQLQGWQYWITIINDNKYVPDSSYAGRELQETPEKCADAGILYTLKNLIG